MDTAHIRNFCIIAHVDHGKSTLADRFLQLTGTVSEREMTEQVLDSMDLERERGVTIKASAVRMTYLAADGQTYELNLIDTPGHVDFSYEVSRALAACEGALLVVDATQGVEAQTLANLYLALESNLEIIPLLNKIDLPSARTEEVAGEIVRLLGVARESILSISAKNGTNVAAVLEAVVRSVPPPSGSAQASTRALIFDSHYDAYKGVVAYVRVREGELNRAHSFRLMSTGAEFDPIEVGHFSPGMRPNTSLSAGEVGYVATGFKGVRECRVGDTITSSAHPASEPLPGYRRVKPMVFAGVYPVEGEDYAALKDALEKLQLNDASLVFEPETSQALNFGFRCGFLGLFHMEIFQIAEVREPWMEIEVFTPDTYYGTVMDLVTQRRGTFAGQEYPAPGRVQLRFELPLSELIIDFYDQLKSRTRGYASLDYHVAGYRADDLVRLDILINEEPVDALASIVHRDQAYNKGQRLVTKLKAIIPRQLYAVPIQAAAGGRVISRANVKPLRKDVLAKCYGGDITRKKKLLEKQKRGKRRMKMVGNVEIPQEAFMAILRIEGE
ncbi:MAG: translation elongation factor 4 [Chloroflexi bacterium]|nr:translation elongation factor 4 [Chloroflexota bacterium]